jgi:hypothetical protein
VRFSSQNFDSGFCCVYTCSVKKKKSGQVSICRIGPFPCQFLGCLLPFSSWSGAAIQFKILQLPIICLRTWCVIQRSWFYEWCFRRTRMRVPALNSSHYDWEFMLYPTEDIRNNRKGIWFHSGNISDSDTGNRIVALTVTGCCKNWRFRSKAISSLNLLLHAMC